VGCGLVLVVSCVVLFLFCVCVTCFFSYTLLFTPSCSHPSIRTLLFTGVAQAERLHATRSPVHTFLFTPSCSHPSIHRGGAGGASSRNALSCSHLPVHTLLFKPFHSQGWRGRSVSTQRSLLFTPSCSRPPVHTLPFTGVARAETRHALSCPPVHTLLFTPFHSQGRRGRSVSTRDMLSRRLSSRL